MKDKLIIVGGGGHCRACIDVIEQTGQFDIKGIIDKKGDFKNYCDYPYLGSDEEIAALVDPGNWFLIGVGQIKTSKLRYTLFETVKFSGGQFPVIISPNAYVSPQATIGKGTIVMHGAIINAGAKISENCIINTRAVIEHDVQVGSHVHISTGAILNGGVKVRDHSFVGSMAMVKQEVVIGKDSVIQAGSSVFKNVLDSSIHTNN